MRNEFTLFIILVVIMMPFSYADDVVETQIYIQSNHGQLSQLKPIGGITNSQTDYIDENLLAFNPALSWHPLQQITTNQTSMVSVDADDNGIIDEVDDLSAGVYDWSLTSDVWSVLVDYAAWAEDSDLIDGLDSSELCLADGTNCDGASDLDCVGCVNSTHLAFGDYNINILGDALWSNGTDYALDSDLIDGLDSTELCLADGTNCAGNMPTCASGEIIKYNGTDWECGSMNENLLQSVSFDDWTYTPISANGHCVDFANNYLNMLDNDPNTYLYCVDYQMDNVNTAITLVVDLGEIKEGLLYLDAELDYQNCTNGCPSGGCWSCNQYTYHSLSIKTSNDGISYTTMGSATDAYQGPTTVFNFADSYRGRYIKINLVSTGRYSAMEWGTVWSYAGGDFKINTIGLSQGGVTGGSSLQSCLEGEILQYGASGWECSVSDNSSLWNESGYDIYRETGNVGIGTTTPTEKLDVDGNVKASGIICDSNGCIGSSLSGWSVGGIRVDDYFCIQGGVDAGGKRIDSVNMNDGRLCDEDKVCLDGSCLDGFYAEGVGCASCPNSLQYLGTSGDGVYAFYGCSPPPGYSKSDCDWYQGNNWDLRNPPSPLTGYSTARGSCSSSGGNYGWYMACYD